MKDRLYLFNPDGTVAAMAASELQDYLDSRDQWD